MSKIPIDNLETGMILKSAVCDRSGRLLLPAGQELTAKHLKVFRTWGVTEADIVGDAEESPVVDLPDDADPVLYAEASAAVSRLFVHNDINHPAISELMRLCIARKISHAS